MTMDLPQLADIQRARDNIRAFSHLTPVMTSSFFDDLCGCNIFFKCENFQKIGAFKFRGAMNALRSLSAEQLSHGVITHSSGNHGQAVSLAARLLGTKATVVMPGNSVALKIDAIRGYGADIHFCEPSTAAREKMTADIMARTQATLIHPYNDFAVIAGQGTAFLELHEQVPGLDVLIAPVGGGGLISGCAVAARGLLNQRIKIYGAEPEGAADAARSLIAGRIVTNEVVDTVADGLRATSLGTRTFALIQTNVDHIFTVSDSAILEAMQLVWQRMKILIEPSSAAPLAALIKHREKIAGQKVGIVLSGGNVEAQFASKREPAPYAVC